MAQSIEFLPIYTEVMCHKEKMASSHMENSIISLFDFEESIAGINAVVILDDATESGDTIARLIDIVERKGAKRIYGYVLIKRGDEYSVRRMEKLKRYGKAEVHIRYLADVEVSSYKSHTCPICKKIAKLQWLMRHSFLAGDIKNFLENKIAEIHPLPVSSIGNTYSLGSLEQEALGSNQALYFRWLLELAKTDPGARHELAKIVNNHKSDKDNCLTLFRVTAREGISNIFGMKLPQTIFYKKFINRIIDACRFFLIQIDELSAVDLEAVLYISEYFENHLVLDKYYEILIKLSESKESLIQCIMHGLLSEKFHDFPGIVLSALHKLRDHIIEKSDLSAIVDQTCSYWENRQGRILKSWDHRLNSFEELRGGIFHEIGHLKSNLFSILNDNPIEKDRLIRNWEVFKSEVLRILPLVRNVIATNITTDLCNKLGQRVADVDFRIWQVNKAVNFLTGNEERIDSNSTLISFREDVEMVYKIICGGSGIQAMLSRFETRIKRVAYDTINQHIQSFQEKEMKVIRYFPEELCLTFGEEEHVNLIFHNLIENAWKWSEGKTFAIIGKRDESNEKLSIYFVDDGNGIKHPCMYSQGLKNVQDIVSRCCGHFEILAKDQRPSFIDKKFNTIIHVSLPFLKSQEE